MSNKLILWAVIGFIALMGGCSIISTKNKEVVIHNKFDAEFKNRTAFYDNLTKTVKETFKISLKNEVAFKENVTAIMEGRKDAENLMFKMITESNPNQNFNEVSRLNERVMQLIESKRNELFEIERTLSDIEREHKNLIQQFPGAFVFMIFSVEPINFKPISSSRTDNVIKTGQDNELLID